MATEKFRLKVNSYGPTGEVDAGAIRRVETWVKAQIRLGRRFTITGNVFGEVELDDDPEAAQPVGGE